MAVRSGHVNPGYQNVLPQYPGPDVQYPIRVLSPALYASVAKIDLRKSISTARWRSI